MNEWTRTGIAAGVAAALILAAVFTRPKTVVPNVFREEGQPLFPGFTDVSKVAAMEITAYDADTGKPRPFKVERKAGKWVLPSHHDYPADAEERLKKTAAEVVDLKKDSLRSDRTADHERMGVVDPTDEQAKGTRGRGMRIELKDAEGKVLADFILGDAIEGRKMRYVRLPGQKWVYGVKTEAEFSAKFSDWIETDFLKIDPYDVRRMRFDQYRIEERLTEFVTEDGQKVTMPVPKLHSAEAFQVEQGDDYKWHVDKDPADDAKVSDLKNVLDKLTIVGVKPKPVGLGGDLVFAKDAVLSLETILSLLGRGFFLRVPGGKTMISNEAIQLLSQKRFDVGQLIKILQRYGVLEGAEAQQQSFEVAAKAGEMEFVTEKGVVYTLRFGNVATDEADKSAGEARYVLITVRFDAKWVPAPKPDKRPEPEEEEPWLDWDSRRSAFEKRQQGDEDWEKRSEETMKQRKEEWERKVKDGEKAAADLNKRFAAWYYVISAESLAKLQAKRADLIKK